MKKSELSEVVLEEDPETRFFTKTMMYEDECMKREDHINSLYVRSKVWLAWILLIIPFRIFHVFFYFIIYALWYQILVRFFTHIPIVNRACHCLDFWIKRYFVPFWTWFILLQYGFYRPKVIYAEKDVFEIVCKKYQGTPGKPEKKKPFIVISNHVSYCDSFVMFKHFGERGVIVNSALKDDPIVGPVCRNIGCIFTDSKNIGDKIIEAANEYYDDPLRFKKLMMYPEGTTTNGRKILKFHTGAFLAGRPLDLAYIRYEYKNFDPSWSKVDSALQYLETMNSQIYQTYVIVKFPVYNPNEEEKKDPKLFASNVRRVMVDIANYYTAEKLGKVELTNIKFVRHLRKKKKE